MRGSRCLQCGEVRWNLVGARTMGGERDAACPVCGAETVTERRFPGRAVAGARDREGERRTYHPAIDGPPGRPTAGAR
jgi:hypothetical protein